ncbi:OmpP1/FadL family transporter [Halioglobus maricola]|uniref:OmpP1/FadL family transporter n=1 Tax=Halioglobus maricola TaxID=2601894 RepID=UPI00147832C5|nr:outer membrane protein transport protein [Halioglobus maricola]
MRETSHILIAAAALLLAVSPSIDARPYAGVSGLAASADSAATAGTNPAGAARLDATTARAELIVVQSESTWEGRVGAQEADISSENSTTVVVPAVYAVHPINDDLTFSFTFLGFGYSDDFGEWPGQYFIESYDSLSVSAYPSLAYRVSDRLSIAGSLALTYASFSQERAIANVFDPGFADGTSELETDGIDVGFGLSALYELSGQTRLGLVYNSELDPTQDGEAKFRGLGPNTEQVLDRAGFIGADVEVKSTTPQSLLAGIYHEWDNDHAVVVDLAWADTSNFELSEYYFDGEQLSAHEANWQDVWALSGSYSWPVSDRWMLSAGGMYVSSMTEDDDRIFMLRMDEIWGLAVAGEWQWTEDRTVEINFSYLTIGDAPIESPALPLVGAVTGEYSQRDIFMLRLALNWSRF